MKIGVFFYGIMYGVGGRTGSDRDYRHCWPNLKSYLIEPFVSQGHDVDVFVSTYPFPTDELEEEFHAVVNPRDVYYSEFSGSDPFTAKFASFNLIEKYTDLDVAVLTRGDAHWHKKVAEHNVDLTKFNFLFPEGENWWQRAMFTCDNFYLFPQDWTSKVKEAMRNTYAWPRGKPYVDTHGLIHKLVEQGLTSNDFNMISTTPEISDINSFYCCCRNGLPTHEKRIEHMHQDVRERFGYE